MLRRLVLIAILLSAAPVFGARIKLQKKWVQQHMNQVTTSITMEVMDVKDEPNEPIKDGDIHMGGKSPDAGLPLVAEIMNAGLPPQAKALDFAQSHSGQSIHVTGVWRLWFEHPPTDKTGQVQNINGTIKMTRPSHDKRWTNPDHLFEVHPITEFSEGNGAPLRIANSIHFVDGIMQYDPKKVFKYYENKTVTVSETGGANGTITLTSTKSLYNYVIFLVSLQGDAVQTTSKDGYLLLGEIEDWKGKPIPVECEEDEDSCARRLVVANDTEPYKVLKLATSEHVDGKCFRVLGIPRINLERVNYILQHPDKFSDRVPYLPYEMILVGAETSKLCKPSAP